MVFGAYRSLAVPEFWGDPFSWHDFLGTVSVNAKTSHNPVWITFELPTNRPESGGSEWAFLRMSTIAADSLYAFVEIGNERD
jgi:hypothetical protein